MFRMHRVRVSKHKHCWRLDRGDVFRPVEVLSQQVSHLRDQHRPIFGLGGGSRVSPLKRALILAAMAQLGPAVAEQLKHSPLSQAYSRTALTPDNCTVLVPKMGELLRKVFEWLQLGSR